MQVTLKVLSLILQNRLSIFKVKLRSLSETQGCGLIHAKYNIDPEIMISADIARHVNEFFSFCSSQFLPSSSILGNVLITVLLSIFLILVSLSLFFFFPWSGSCRIRRYRNSHFTILGIYIFFKSAFINTDVFQ